MSKINIRRAVENIRPHTNIYSPVIEIIVNAIQAIDECNTDTGRVVITVLREGEHDLVDSLPEVTGFSIQDNGIGFTDTHRDAFDTLYTDHRIEDGGKGFGRFICLKYFENVKVDSVYKDDSNFISRSFRMGKSHDIIVDEKTRTTNETSSSTYVTVSGFLKHKNTFEKKLITIARNLVEYLLPYFITEGYDCPKIFLQEHDNNGTVCLNDFVGNEVSAFIQEVSVAPNQFYLHAKDTKEDFKVRVFKIYSPKNQKSQINLVAHQRAVSNTPLEQHIPEFAEDFHDRDKNGLHKSSDGKNFIIKAYTFGSYLDRHVSLERGNFAFSKESDLEFGISQEQIECQVAAIAESVVGQDIGLRKQRKRTQVQTYVDQEAPWHIDILREVDLTDLPHKPTDLEIENHLQHAKLIQEFDIRGEVERILSEDNLAEIKDDVIKLVERISGTSKNDLVHYIALRRKLLDIFEKSLELSPTGKYSAEQVVHDIIFPRRQDKDSLPFHNHNLWILDERLNFTNYVSSDKALEGANSGRPDLIVYNNRVLFRGDNDPSNPITIFEFKKPQRDDFVDPSKSEDPVQQVVRYVNKIRAGNCTTPKGRPVRVAPNTPFFGFVVCDLTIKIETWLKSEKNFDPMPDNLGWFQWMKNINLYIEVISWEKVRRDAEMRNKIFFQKLGID